MKCFLACSVVVTLALGPSGCALMLPVAVVGSMVTSHVETAPAKEQMDAPWCGAGERAQVAYRVTLDVFVRPGWWPGDYRWRERSRNKCVWWTQIVEVMDAYADRTGAAQRRWWPYDAYVPCVDPLLVVLVERADLKVFFPRVSTNVVPGGRLLWCDPMSSELPREVELDEQGRPHIPTAWGRLNFVPTGNGWRVESAGPAPGATFPDGFFAFPRPEKSDDERALIPPC